MPIPLCRSDITHRAGPLGATPNGVLNHVGFLSEQLKAMGHQTTILADVVAQGDHDRGVYNLQRVRTTIARNPLNRIMYGVWRNSQPRL